MTRRAMLTLQHDIGVDVSGFMSGRVGLPEAAYPPERQGLFFERMVEELEAQPGVLAATAANTMPATGSVDVLYAVDGRSYASRSDYPEADGVIVAPGFFAAFGLPLLQGRDFNSADRYGTPGVAIVNQALARAHFGSASPLGRRIQLVQDEGAGPWLTIVGVVPNVLHDDAWDEGGRFPPTIYQPVSQQPWRFMTVAVRTAGEPHAFADTIRETARRLDPDLAVYWLLTLEEYQDKARAALVLLSEIFMIFAGIAVVLAAVGIYGVLSFATGQRNREIGVRRALGARDRQILLTVMRSAALQLGAGLLLGIVFAPLVARTLTRGLEGMPPDDPLVYVFVFTLLIVVSLVASWVPALRALRVQPAAALRHE